jgi:putative N6-adenine-specific DNA methylase
MSNKLNALAIPARGFEDVCAAEVREILEVVAKGSKGVVSFPCELLELCEYIYRAQTPGRVLAELIHLKASDDIAEKLSDKITESILLPWLPNDATFVVRAQTDTEEIPRQELEYALGDAIHTKLGNKVDLKNPDVTFVVLIEQGQCYLAVDISGPDLGKRDYRIFLGPEALKGHIAASLVRLSGYHKKQTFLDLFCRNGIIPIEAALMAAKRSPHFFGKEKFAFRKLPMLKETDWESIFAKIDKQADAEASATIIAMDPGFNNISAAKKNAKIAGIVKTITFSRTDLQFLDAKFGKKAINTLVTLPPQPSVNLSKQRVDAMLKEVFYQAEFVMKSGGTCVLITRTGADVLKAAAAEYKFTLKDERKVWQGDAELVALVFQK